MEAGVWCRQIFSKVGLMLYQFCENYHRADFCEIVPGGSGGAAAQGAVLSSMTAAEQTAVVSFDVAPHLSALPVSPEARRRSLCPHQRQPPQPPPQQKEAEALQHVPPPQTSETHGTSALQESKMQTPSSLKAEGALEAAAVAHETYTDWQHKLQLLLDSTTPNPQVFVVVTLAACHAVDTVSYEAVDYVVIL